MIVACDLPALVCEECYELEFEVCDTLIIAGGLTPLTTYYIIITDKFANTYKQTVITDADGDFILNYATLPSGLFNQHAGDFEVIVYTSNTYTTKATLTFGYLTYNCIILNFVDTPPEVECCDPESEEVVPTPCELLLDSLNENKLNTCILPEYDFCDEDVINSLTDEQIECLENEFGGGAVNIKDQDGNVIAQPACGTDYTVLVFSGIDEGNSSTVYTNSIVES